MIMEILTACLMILGLFALSVGLGIVAAKIIIFIIELGENKND